MVELEYQLQDGLTARPDLVLWVPHLVDQVGDEAVGLDIVQVVSILAVRQGVEHHVQVLKALDVHRWIRLEKPVKIEFIVKQYKNIVKINL